MKWLTAQLDKDQADVELAIGIELENLAQDGRPTTREALLAEVSWPNRGLREVEAKRQMLDEHLSYYGEGSDANWPVRVLTWLALPYADRPGYRDEWKP